MASFVKYQCFAEHLAEGVHNLDTGTLRVMLSNTAPNVATHTVRADVTELSTGNRYTSGGIDVSNATTNTTGTVTVSATDAVWTASGGSIGPFRYVILFNDTPTSPADPLIGYWDIGTNVTITTGNTFTADFTTNCLQIGP
jgi:hypothetical protein